MSWVRTSPDDLPLDSSWLWHCDRRDEARVLREAWPFSWGPPAPCARAKGSALPPAHPLLWVTAKVWPAVVE